MYCIYDGQLFPQNGGYLNAGNRSFLYGDGLFESIRIVNGKPSFLESHISRLFEGMQVLKIERPINYSLNFFKEHIESLIRKNNITEGGKCRLTVFRNSTGTYTPHQNDASFVIDVFPYEYNRYTLNDEGMTVEIFPDIKKPVNKLSIYKTCNSLTYIMAGLYARQNKLEDALIINERGNIIESSNSNLFIVCNGVLYTPALTDGCLAGVMRMQIINLAIDNKYKVYECSLTPQNLLVADEIFLTNAVRGLQWVGSYKMKRYFNKHTKDLLSKLNDLVANT